MKNYGIYLGGDFITTAQQLPVKNPYTGEVFATTFLASSGELEKAIQKAESARARLAEMPSYQVSEALFQVSAMIRQEREALAKVLSMESGKPIRYALGEIDRATQTFLVAGEESKRIPGEYLSLDWTPAGEGKEAWVKYFPVGLVAGIAPFNFPMNLAVHKIAPALASGNPIILKPARSTPLSVLELARIVDRTPFPKGALSILPMDRESGNQLVTDSRFNMLTFTGSPEVGWKMKTDAGKKKVVLELGGNAGVIVAQSANIEKAVERCLVGGYAYSGQVCIHVQRIYVHESLFDRFAEKFVRRVEKLNEGDPLDPATDISVMIDEENAQRVSEWVSEAVKAGGKILTGGEKKGAYFQPTVLTNTGNEMKVCSLEIFGPVVTLEPFESFQQALDEVNNSRYGLQAGVFTNTVTEMNRAFNQLQVGGVVINDVPTFRVDHMPYGGVKDSGLGREGVKYAIHEMLEPRLLVKDKL